VFSLSHLPSFPSCCSGRKKKPLHLFNKIKNQNDMGRKLMVQEGHRVSWLQLLGFMLMLVSIFYLLANLFFFSVTADDMAVNFFIIILGFSFSFPDMLKDENKEISTMRMAVFMVVSVITMLLLKIGWNSKSLKEIGLDQFWMGVIAFVFGAKAIQYFFESRLAAATGATRTALLKEETNTTTTVLKAEIEQLKTKKQLLLDIIARVDTTQMSTIDLDNMNNLQQEVQKTDTRLIELKQTLHQ